MEATRVGFSRALLDLGKTNPDVMVLDADLAKSTLTKNFMDKYPERFFDIGIAEQDMLGTAAGLALAGKIPFACTYGVFIAGRAWDQIRTTICYGDINVNVCGMHGGISVGPDGATHQALEEIGLMRVLPNMTVLVPCDSIESYKATMAAANEVVGPTYLRFGREAVPIITKEEDPFEVGKANVLTQGNDCAIVACGFMVGEALDAAKELKEEEGINCRVINMHTVKPLDEEVVLKAAKECGAIVTAEEHQAATGLGGAVAEFISQKYPVPMKIIGIQDRFGESGQPWELLEEFNLTWKDIKQGVKRVMKMKREKVGV
ncbi:MAG: transketolase family protein [Candidatus Eremiobacteraeota bacterium]|nr:transketolase family protein [Candidatus Eremiobacteraeota bacterium]